MSAVDQQMMRRALDLARRGLWSTDPNPRVGCVIARGDVIVGEGWHEVAGQAHAEVMALRAAGEQARGATAYVTLEPCAHTGRTPPCTQGLIAAGVSRVVFAARDPDPRVNGAGAGQLRAAGIATESGLLANEARSLNPGFFKRNESGMPWVRVKLGASMDGRTALANGESRWITGKQARHDAQNFRARSSAVLTGIGTILADDPALNVRLDGAERQPLRVILDSTLRAPKNARVFHRDGPSCIFTAVADSSRYRDYETLGAQVVRVDQAASGGLDLHQVLAQLAARHCNEIWVEAGAHLAGSFVHAGLVDELIVYVAPALLGADARPLVQLPLIERLQDRVQLRFVETVGIGDDLRITAVPAPREI